MFNLFKTMTQERYDSLIQELTLYSVKHPKAYRVKIIGLMGLGFSYIFTILFVSIGLLLLMLGIGLMKPVLLVKLGKVVILLGIIPFIILKALWMSFGPPEGILLTKKDVPRLYETVKKFGQKLKAEKIHGIFLDNDFNASMYKRPLPLIGFLGFSRNYLTLGLPLMQALSREQLDAVIAHELGHLSKNHGAFSAWVYRQRAVFGKVLDQMECEEHWGMFLFRPFCNWFFPFFNAYAFVLARENEYEADRCAVEMTSAKVSAEALINLELKGEALSKDFWTPLLEKAKEKKLPPVQVYEQTALFFKKPLPLEKSRKYYAEALLQKTKNNNTHPALPDRLKAMDYSSNGNPPVLEGQESSADFYLADQYEMYLKEWSEDWKESVTPYWEEKHEDYQELRQELEKLKKKGPVENLSLEDNWLYTMLVLRSETDDAALPLLINLIKRKPDHVSAHYEIGRILLEKKNPKGLTHLDWVLKKDFDSFLMVHDDLYGYYDGLGEHEKAKEIIDKYFEHEEQLEKADKEAAQIDPKSEFIPHAMSAEDIKELEEQLAPLKKRLEGVYLVRKVLKSLPEKEVYMMGYVRNKPFFEMGSDEKDIGLYRAILNNIAFEKDTYIFSMTRGEHKKMLKIMEKVGDSRIL